MRIQRTEGSAEDCSVFRELAVTARTVLDGYAYGLNCLGTFIKVSKLEYACRGQESHVLQTLVSKPNLQQCVWR